MEVESLRKLKEDINDMSSWNYLYLYYEKYLFKIVKSYRFDDYTCEDLIQEIWVKVFRFYDKYDTNRSFKTWLCTIAVNICKTNWTRQKNNNDDISDEKDNKSSKMKNILFDEDYMEDVNEKTFDRDFAEDIANQELIRYAKSMVKNKKHLLAFELKYLKCFSIKDIADFFKEPEDRVKNWIYAGRTELQKYIKKTDFK